MIERIYVDNYKCLVNFDFTPGRLQLFLGRNGGGKSAVFEVLEGLRRLITSAALPEEMFPPDSRTQWLDHPIQTFEIEVSGNGGRYKYRLELEQLPRSLRVHQEHLTFNGAPLFGFVDGEVQLYRDSGSKGPQFRLDWSRSGVAVIAPSHDNRKMTWFKDRVARTVCRQLNPFAMDAASPAEADDADYCLTNFASWYRHLAHERPVDAVERLFVSLREIIDGFESLRLATLSGDQRELLVSFSQNGSKLTLPFSALSDGQRGLVTLYTLLHCATDADATLGIDEPDNFVALSEIEPWLVELAERTEATGAQVFLVSHHPEVINRLAADYGVLFYREGLGPTRVRRFEVAPDVPLLPAELVARGWDG